MEKLVIIDNLAGNVNGTVTQIDYKNSINISNFEKTF